MKQQNRKFLNFAQLSAKLGDRSRSSIGRDIKAERLPKPVKMGGLNYWPEDVIDGLMSEMVEAEAA